MPSQFMLDRFEALGLITDDSPTRGAPDCGSFKGLVQVVLKTPLSAARFIPLSRSETELILAKIALLHSSSSSTLRLCARFLAVPQWRARVPSGFCTESEKCLIDLPIRA